MRDTSRCPALFLSAPASHQGKTTVTAGLARHFRKLGLKVIVFKTGPDFLDPMILERASGNTVYQLDLWMMGEDHCRQLVFQAAQNADVILIEGVMGLYDGDPCSADLAALFDMPVALVINAQGMAQSIQAIAHGLFTYGKPLKRAGIIANNVASQRHIEMLSDSSACLSGKASEPAAPPAAAPMLSCLPKSATTTIPSRHLGLLQADELDNLDQILDRVAGAIADSDLGKLPAVVEFKASAIEPPPKEALLSGKKIGIAKDRAFSFVYQDNLDWLTKMGATIEWFSPLTDTQLPIVDAVYLPGGYPELHLETLSDNHAMKSELRRFHKAGHPIYAECGGMLYLLDKMADANGVQKPLVGLIAGSATMQSRLSALGYQTLSLGGQEARGHTFHYSKLHIELDPTLHAKKRSDHSEGEPVFQLGNLLASYVHLYFPSAPLLLASIFKGRLQD